MGSEDIKQARIEEQQMMRNVIVRLAVGTESEIQQVARTFVERGYAEPEYRGKYYGESDRNHAEFVSSRLRLIRAMRDYRTSIEAKRVRGGN